MHNYTGTSKPLPTIYMCITLTQTRCMCALFDKSMYLVCWYRNDSYREPGLILLADSHSLNTSKFREWPPHSFMGSSLFFHLQSSPLLSSPACLISVWPRVRLISNTNHKQTA